MVNKYQRAVDMLNSHLKNKIVQSNDGDYGEFINRMINGTLELTEYENDEVTKINTYLFRRCESLTSVSFPVCTSIGAYAFYGCTALTSVSFPACTSIGAYAFEECTALTSVSFPVCTSIGEYAFEECESLTSVSFPVCTSIGEYAFYGCTALTSLYFTGSSVPSIASNSFNNIPSTATFYVASSMVDAFKSASYWSAFASQIVAYTE